MRHGTQQKRSISLADVAFPLNQCPSRNAVATCWGSHLFCKYRNKTRGIYLICRNILMRKQNVTWAKLLLPQLLPMIFAADSSLGWHCGRNCRTMYMWWSKLVTSPRGLTLQWRHGHWEGHVGAAVRDPRNSCSGNTPIVEFKGAIRSVFTRGIFARTVVDRLMV